MIYLALLVIIGPFLVQPLGLSNVLLPLVGVLFQALGFGLALLLASFVVFFQDLSQVFGIIMRMWMWLTPVVYIEAILSERVLSLLRWNPAYFFIKSFRDLFLFNQIPPWNAWATMMVWVTGFVFLSAWVLQLTRPKLRDLL